MVFATSVAAGLAALAYAALSGEAWPVPFAVTMLVCALVVIVGKLLG